MTSDLAHQLRTPIASVRATLEAVADGVLPLDATTLATLTDQTDRLARLVADLEKVSRAQERQLVLQPEPQPIAPVVRRCAAALQGRARAAGVDVVTQLDAATPAVRIDADRIAEALENVLDNALRHTPPGGQISIAAGPAMAAERPAVLVTVTDTGDGFDPQDAERLFERFHRGVRTESATGSGLGLTIARALVEAHSGTLTASTPGPGRGATLTLILPVDA